MSHRIIVFDTAGNPQPTGLINLNYSEFKLNFIDNFTNSTTRKVIYSGYERYVNDFKSEICTEFDHWINGSFTTSKVDPNDIDLINVIPYTDEINGKTLLIRKFLTLGGSKIPYKVDGYWIPVYDQSDPRYQITIDSINYWLKWFGHDRMGRPKGIIEMIFN